MEFFATPGASLPAPKPAEGDLDARPVEHTVAPEATGQAPLALSWTAGHEGEAPWLFVHGLGADRNGDKARRFRDHLTARGRPFGAFDFTGHGDSGGDCRGLSLSRNIEDIGRVVRFLRAAAPGPPPGLIGSSMGGIAALWYAGLHPGSVSAVYAIAPAFGMARRLAASLSAPERRAWAQRGFLSFPIGDRVLDFGWGAVTDEDRYPDEALAARLTTPSLLLHGAADAVVPVELSRDFAASCPAATLLEIEGGDHRLGAHRDLLFELIWTRAPENPARSRRR